VANKETERSVLRDLAPTLITMAFLLLFGILFYNQYYEASQNTALSATASKILLLLDAAVQKGNPKTVELKPALEEVLLSEVRQSFMAELFLHMAVALIVAFSVIGSVEISGAVRRRREAKEQEKRLSLAVWSALFERFIPEKVVREIEDIARIEVIKERCYYTITFLPPYPGMPEDSLIVKREVRYSLRRTKNRDIVFPLNSTISSEAEDYSIVDKDGSPAIVPRHVSLTVAGTEIELTDDVVKRNERGQRRNLEFKVPISGNEDAVDIDLCAEEVMPCQGYNSYLQLSPVIDFYVEVHNRYEEKIKILEVQFNHPNFANFKRRRGWVFEYLGGILPGQSFHVSWARVTPK
jgi:hypothetical protein